MRILVSIVLVVSVFSQLAPGVAADAPPVAKVPFNDEQAKQFQRQWARHLAAGVTVTNSLGMAMVLVPPGEFRQGASRVELDVIAREIEQDNSGDKDAWDVGSILAHDVQWHDGRFHVWYAAAANDNRETDPTIRIGYALSTETTAE